MQKITIVYADKTIIECNTKEEWLNAPPYEIAFIVQGSYIIEGGDLYYLQDDTDVLQSTTPYSTAIALGAKIGKNLKRDDYRELLAIAQKILGQGHCDECNH